MHLRKIPLMVIVLALICFMSPAIAQDEVKNDGLARVVYITAKDGHNKALEEAITEYHHYMAGHEGSWRYQWYSIITGPDTGKYIARSGDHNWEDFDAKHDWDKEAGEKFASLVQPHIDNMEIIITRTVDDLGMWPESMEGYQYISVTHWYIKPGHGNAFNEGLKKIDKALNEGGWPRHYGFIYPVSGGKGGQYTLVSPSKSFADMAPKEPSFMEIMNKAMGEEEAKAFMAEWTQTYKSGQNQMLRYRPELSDYGK